MEILETIKKRKDELEQGYKQTQDNILQLEKQLIEEKEKLNQFIGAIVEFNSIVNQIEQKD